MGNDMLGAGGGLTCAVCPPCAALLAMAQARRLLIDALLPLPADRTPPDEVTERFQHQREPPCRLEDILCMITQTSVPFAISMTVTPFGKFYKPQINTQY